MHPPHASFSTHAFCSRGPFGMKCAWTLVGVGTHVRSWSRRGCGAGGGPCPPSIYVSPLLRRERQPLGVFTLSLLTLSLFTLSLFTLSNMALLHPMWRLCARVYARTPTPRGLHPLPRAGHRRGLLRRPGRQAARPAGGAARLRRLCARRRGARHAVEAAGEHRVRGLEVRSPGPPCGFGLGAL
jgi:hypothetical protein